MISHNNQSTAAQREIALLASNASYESLIRYQYAQDIAAQCPDDLFLEIALTGSAARGLSNPESDFEINFWVERIPRVDLRLWWLRSIGVENLQLVAQPRRDGSQWISGTYEGIALEAGWQTISDVENMLHALLHAETSNHKDLRLGELFLSAKSLRGGGFLSKWQERLSHYPAALGEKLIAEVLEAWLNEEFIDKENLIRLVFAINQKWEINRKWTQSVELALAPRDFFPRLASIQSEDTEALQGFLLEATLLLPEGYPLREELIARFDFH
jgi:hypothetical protein